MDYYTNKMDMKPSFIIFLLVFTGFLSCNKDEVSLPLTPDLVSEIKAYDLDNNGNSSDIRVDFQVKDNRNVIEYRIMFVPTSVSDLFDVEEAENVPLGNYMEVLPVSFQNQYNFNRLPAGLLDVSGNPINNGIEYVSVVLIFGTGNWQISEFSAPFALRDTHIYSGRYFYGYEKSCILPDDASFQLKGSAEGNYFTNLVQSGDLLIGAMDCTNCGDGFEGAGVEFDFDGTTIIAYRLIHTHYPCNLSQYCEVKDCFLGESGSGTIIDDLVIEMVITSGDCIRDCEGTVVFVRQG